MGKQQKEGNWIAQRISETADKSCKNALNHFKNNNTDELGVNVQAAREELKRIRAMLRLVRAPLKKDYKELNALYRDEAKKTAELQKASAMVDAIDMIHEHYSERLYKNAFTDLRGQLEEHKEELSDKALNEEHLLQEIHQKLEEECSAFKDLVPHSPSFDHISPGIKKVYKQASKALKQVKGSSGFEDLHELQKRVNYLRYQLEVIKPLWPRMMDAWVKELGTLNAVLVANEGLFHLSGYLTKNGDMDTSEDGTHLMVTLINGHSEQLQDHARLLAKRIFYLDPKDFVSYIEKLWQAHQQQNDRQLLPLDKLGFKD